MRYAAVMATSTPSAEYIAALPTFTEAAYLVGIDPSGISRAVKRHGIEPIRWGNREKHLSVTDLLTIARHAHRQPLEAVAGELLYRVEQSHPEQAASIQAEIDEFFAALPPRRATPEAQFIAILRAIDPEAGEELVQIYLDLKRSRQ